MFTPYGETKDGFENQYGVNYLSHFLLTLLLLPLMKNAGSPEEKARIVNVSSCAHLLGDVQFDDINHKWVEISLIIYSYLQSNVKVQKIDFNIQYADFSTFHRKIPR